VVVEYNFKSCLEGKDTDFVYITDKYRIKE